MKLKSGLGILVWVTAAALAGPAAWGQQQKSQVLTLTAARTSYLGIGVADVTPERAKALNLKEERGAEVTSVREDSPASKAGIKEGDVVLEYNGQQVQGTEQLTRLVRETPIGRQAKILVWRGGSTQTLMATIAENKGTPILSFGGSAMIPGPGEWQLPRVAPMDIPQFNMTWRSPTLGIIGEALGEQNQLAEFFGVKEGVLVKSVTKNSAAEKAGIKAGDVITKIGDAQVSSTDEIRKAMASVDSSKNTVIVMVIRNRKEVPVTVTIERPSGGGGRPVRAQLFVRYC